MQILTNVFWDECLQIFIAIKLNFCSHNWSSPSTPTIFANPLLSSVPDRVCSLGVWFHIYQQTEMWETLLLVVLLSCLSGTWTVDHWFSDIDNVIVLMIFQSWGLDDIQRVLAKVWVVLLVARPSVSSLVVLKQTSSQWPMQWHH